MPDFDPVLVGSATGMQLRIARVVHVDEASLLVSLPGSEELFEVRSRLPAAATDPGQLETGDQVVVGIEGEHLMLLGRVVPLHPTKEIRIPDAIVLEAKNGLTLRVGDGSITIRADGKILIKGKDLVSHAQNVNRIKGGAVSIN
jgi:hypothetical protein